MPLTAMDLVAAAKRSIREVDHATAWGSLDCALVLDVREPDEYAAGCLPGAINIPRGVLEFNIESHPALQGRRETPILVYCQSGGRSALAAEALQKLGYTNVCSLAGGIKAWREAGLPVDRSATPS